MFKIISLSGGVTVCQHWSAPPNSIPCLRVIQWQPSITVATMTMCPNTTAAVMPTLPSTAALLMLMSPKTSAVTRYSRSTITPHSLKRSEYCSLCLRTHLYFILCISAQSRILATYSRQSSAYFDSSGSDACLDRRLLAFIWTPTLLSPSRESFGFCFWSHRECLVKSDWLFGKGWLGVVTLFWLRGVLGLSRRFVLCWWVFLPARPPPSQSTPCSAWLLHKHVFSLSTSDLSAGDPGASEDNWVVCQGSTICRLCATDSSVSDLICL